MRRILRRLFNLLSTISMLLRITFTVLWVRGHWWPSQITAIVKSRTLTEARYGFGSDYREVYCVSFYSVGGFIGVQSFQDLVNGMADSFRIRTERLDVVCRGRSRDFSI